MIIIPRVERSIEIHAPVKNVFNILDDAKLGIKWNLPISEISEITEGTYIVKSNLGFPPVLGDNVANQPFFEFPIL